MSDASPTLALLRRHGVRNPTLSEYLIFNFVEPYADLDAELLEILPARFHEEFCERLRLQREYNDKFDRNNFPE